MIDYCAACSGFDPRTEPIFVWPTGSCSGSDCLCIRFFYVCKRTYDTGIIPSLGQRLKKKERRRKVYLKKFLFRYLEYTGSNYLQFGLNPIHKHLQLRTRKSITFAELKTDFTILIDVFSVTRVMEAIRNRS